MKKVIVIFVVIFALMEGISWWVYTSFNSKDMETVEREQDPITSPKNLSKFSPQALKNTHFSCLSTKISSFWLPARNAFA